MHTDGFWNLMEGAATPHDLHAALDRLPQGELEAFERLHRDAYDRGYDWGLWGAAYVIGGGCSDDHFDYFRAYLLSRGRAIFEAALADPDTLADAAVDEEESWEAWMSPTMHVVRARTGKWGYLTTRQGPPPTRPTGAEWDEDELETRFPRLSTKFAY